MAESIQPDCDPQPAAAPRAGADDALELLWSAVHDVADYAICMLDAQGHVITWNVGAQAMYGHNGEQIRGAPLARLYRPEDIAAGAPQRDLRAATEGGRAQCEGWRLRRDGSQFWASAALTALYQENGRVRGFLQITRDVTERRRHEQALRDSEERFRRLVEGVRDYAIFSLDPRGYIISWNAGARHIKGYEAEEVIGTHFSRFYTPEAITQRWPEHELREATTEGRFEDEGWRIRKDGSRFWANVVITALRDAGGTLLGFTKITRDLSERRKHEETLRLSEERFRLLIESVTDHAMFLLDANGSIATWNSGAERITGYREAEILQRHFSRLYPPERIAASQPWRDLAAAGEQGRLCREGWCVRKDGSSFWSRTVIGRLLDSSGRLQGYAHLTQDLTQQRHSEALEDAARRMNEFIAMLGHELRNPLAPIRNAVMLMERKGLGDTVLESMRATIARQTDILSRIVDELLDMSRIARGQLMLERSVLDLTQVVAGAVEVSRPLIERRRHQLQLSVPPQSLPVLGDALRLTQLIVNLLNNAAKYTPPGGRIELSVSAADAGVELRVRDDGVGIRPEALPRLFDLFYQGPQAAEPVERGLGVGLALARQIVELHGGRIDARSDGPGRGSEFIVSLPPATAAVSSAPGRAGAEPTPALPRLRIVIADDNTDSAISLACLLESFGQQVRLAFDGVTALAEIERLRPQVVMLDIGMPTLDGHEVARRIRASPAGAAAVLVAVTGWGQEADRERSAQAGFDFHFVKPVSEVELRRVLLHAGATTPGQQDRA